MQSHIVEVTPTLDTNAYASGDRLGSIMTLSGACPSQGEGATLRAITVVDKAKQSQAITVMLFDASPTVASADNAAIDITDAEMADKSLGTVAIATGDYFALANSSVATKQTTMPLKPAAGSSTLYALMVCSSGTPTYAASDLVVRFHFDW